MSLSCKLKRDVFRTHETITSLFVYLFSSLIPTLYSSLKSEGVDFSDPDQPVSIVLTEANCFGISNFVLFVCCQAGIYYNLLLKLTNMVSYMVPHKIHSKLLRVLH